ncbi:hypothetical protein LTR54_005002 [Friedmanniomyces endolithicus]|uniref:Uncharacterized protein n=1 Tax=Friedmanniomyces endolithicus TaxID=329885 RepID=A0AAN6FXY8_9PEZI|nr:hypothetical protein LTS00_004718 [Friedmanniomyces endolithicus]KAK0325360.1 hypothetical protein LTR82_003643 [Friedmanniomyces endolithicus]KAK1011084.1 hypothetical protein LTR54_005002 [Friedmanniomyces endolithicus]
MPSLEESRRQVKESLSLHRQGLEIDHDDILAGLQEEIDKHNAVKEDFQRMMGRSKRGRETTDERATTHDRPVKFRFKDGVEAPRKRRHHRHRDDKDTRRKHEKEDYPTPPQDEPEAAHPFPRNPTDLEEPGPTSGDAAFRASLFDALADDEGALYWESVYAQPIHVYSRPSVSIPQGELEQMDDEDYAAYVKTRMWEKKHPEVLLERERSARVRREEEEERTKRREEFLRRREQAAWDRAERRGARRQARGEEEEASGDEGRREYAFAGEGNTYADVPVGKARRSEYASAWTKYLAAWDRLKLELLDERSAPATDHVPASKRIPWPVLASKAVIRANIEDFMRHAPADDERTKLQLLKAERVRWHPDKIQQRFAGAVDEGTMKLVTGVFQVVDALFEEERAKGS